MLADNTQTGEIAYGVIAGVVWVSWVAVAIWAACYKKGEKEGKKASGSPQDDAVMTEAQ